jgi:cell wall-associated NlpC family hydrolase
MIKSSDIIRVAREYLGTPWHHCGRVKGKEHGGLDCVGLVSCTCKELGIRADSDLPSYSRHPDGKLLVEQIEKLDVTRLDYEDDVLYPADIIVFRFIGERPTHLGFLTDQGLIHTYRDVGRVVEHRIDDTWKRRIHLVFRFNNIEQDLPAVNI